MKYTPLQLAAVAALASAATARGQAPLGKEADPPIVTVCDVLRAPLDYDGHLIKIRGRLSGTDEGTWLADAGCPGALVTDGHVWPSEVWLAAPGWRFIFHPVDFQFDKKSARRFNRSYNKLRRRLPEQCIVSTLTGLFETRSNWSQFKRVYPNGTREFTGFGHLGGAPGQLVIKSEDDVAVDPNCNGGPRPLGH
jgi:hypothetical protein